MTRDTDYKISVMQAYKDGKRIEYTSGSYWVEWMLPQEPTWNWVECDYRVKEEPKYVPYENTEELIEDFCKRSGAKRSPMGEPFIWLKEINSTTKRLVVTYFDESLNTQYCNAFDNWTMKELFEKFTFLNGSPVGKKVE